MPDYKDLENKLHWLDDKKDVDLLPEGCVEITVEEADVIRQIEIDLAANYVPSEVSMRQTRLALSSDGSLQAVTDAIAAMTGPDGEKAQIEWEFGTVVMRSHWLVLAMQSILGKTDQEMDDLFILANTF